MMKKYIYQLLCSLFIGGTMVACAEDYMETDKGHDTLTLSVNQQELVLNEKNHSQEALALSWTTGTNYGSGNRISYTLEIAKAGTDFARALFRRFRNGNLSVDEENGRTQSVSEHAARRRLCRKSISWKHALPLLLPEWKKRSSVPQLRWIVTTYQPVTTDALPHRRSCS